MNVQESYRLWIEKATEDEDLVKQLKSYTPDSEEVFESFYRNLEFGTGGLRGVIGAGTNRMNIYTIRKATQGLANYLLNTLKSPKVAIAYDSRIKSDIFAKNAAALLAANGIDVYIYKELMPTPALSYAVRYFNCDAGICVTASHNPAKYNGYKVYGSDGCQITIETANGVLKEIESLDIFADIKMDTFENGESKGKIHLIGEDAVDSFINDVKKQSLTNVTSNMKLVYTPLNGAGRMCVLRILKEIGITDVTVVKEQEMPDGNFPTCSYPNPEKKEALQKGLELCEKVGADLLLATDPDCDRVGIAVKDTKGEYKLLSGNEVGVLLLDYIANVRTITGRMPKNPVAVKTIVTTDMANAIAQKYGIELIETLTGFKFIGEQIGILEKNGEADRYIFGFEESYGYLSGSHVRDKDAVNASMLICEMASYYLEKGIDLTQRLDELYKEVGYYKNSLLDFAFEGSKGMAKMEEMMNEFRQSPMSQVADYKVREVLDYNAGVGELPKSNVLSYIFENGAKVLIRPSGTEPKLKIYLSVRGEDEKDANNILNKLEKAMAEVVSK